MKSKMKRGGFIIILTLALAFLLGLSVSFATNYNSVSGEKDKLQIHKKLDSNGQSVPTHTVRFTTTFSQSDSEPSGLSITGSVPAVDMEFSGSTKDVSKDLDFTGVTFKGPGNYCFKVTESSISLPTIKPVANSESFYYIWIHVANGDIDTATGNTNLVIDSYSASAGSDKTAKINYDEHEGLVFENEWDNYNMYVEKKVAGPQADKDKEFTIYLHLKKQSNKPNTPGTNKVKVYAAAGTPKVGGKAVTDTDPYEISLTGSTSANTPLSLKDGDKVFIDGMNDIMEYAVTEASVDDYTPSGTVDRFTSIVGNNGITVTVLNTHKHGTVPTGLFLNNWPYITVVVIALLGCIFFIRRRKARYDYEADL